jgi:uncharacterized protein YaaR (DUF327 family)
MKINPGWRPFSRPKLADNVNPQQIPQKGFSDMLSQHDEQPSAEQLRRLIERIDQQALRLAKSMTVRELLQYKLYVRQFLEETARRGIQLKDTRGWDRRGRTKRYKLLEEIDSRLTAMADELLDSEQGRIDLLARVGEIKGLLINYFF